MVIETKVVIDYLKLQLWMWLVDLNYNFECDWLIELSHSRKLSDNKMSDNNLASLLVENRSFFKLMTMTNLKDYLPKSGFRCF